jgi:hypothetical protein
MSAKLLPLPVYHLDADQIRLSDDPGGDMKAIVAAIATIALSGCATSSYEDAQKDDLAATPIATSALDEEDKIRRNCEEEWRGDWSTIAFCFKRQWAGYRQLHP